MKSRVGLVAIPLLAVMLSTCNGQPQPASTQAIATEVPSATTAPTRVIEKPTATRTATTEPTKTAPTSTPRPSPTPFPIIIEARNGTEVMLQVRTWSLPSPDSRYFYFTTMFVPDGCGIFINGSDVQQVDVATGHLTELVPRVSSALSLSPDTTILAYIAEGPTLVLRHLATSAEQQIKLNVLADSPAGNIVWSPDGNAIMLTTAVSPCGPPDWAQSVIRVDVATLSQTTMLDDDKRLLHTVEWPEAEKVLLEDWNGNFWWLNPTSGDLTPKGN